MEYNPQQIEPKWRQLWKENAVYRTENASEKPKYYVLDMFPYPSGSGLHVGHPLGYIASDIFARYKRHKGFNVLHPMGFDAFGLPAEQYAIQTGKHPSMTTAENVQRYREQLDNIGMSYDWARMVTTSDPAYYKWTQWIFLQLFEHYYDKTANKAMPIADLKAKFAEAGNAAAQAVTTQTATFSAAEWNAMDAAAQDEILMNYRLAYRKIGYVNWCEALGTVLANDEVKDGVSERGGHPVEQRAMLQWSLRITAYAERLLTSLDNLEWSEALKSQQRNWIGRSEGAKIIFDLDGHADKIEVFTTRPDTIFGATFMVLAPELGVVERITTAEQHEEVQAYLAYVNARTERERMAEVKEVTGAFTGAFAINPFTEQKIPVYISEYVLKDYGTGAIMAVPSDDERDQRFALKFGLEIIDVVDKSDYPNATLDDKVGKIINSGFLNGLEVKDAIRAAIDEVERRGIGEGRVNYRLRDANFSRQRYWGEPFPIRYKDGVTLPETELPLELPDLTDFRPSSGKAPLARLTEWVNMPDGATRETDTMPGFAGSSWYFLRYMDATNPDEAFSAEAVNYWQAVDLYVGGTEHAVGHLMYSRFWHKFLYDKNLVPTQEPFLKLINQGMIQGRSNFVYRINEQTAQQVFGAEALQTDGSGTQQIFVSLDVVEEKDLHKVVTPLHVYVNLVQNDVLDVQAFRAWRPDNENAVFIFNKNGEYLCGYGIEKMSKTKHNVVNPDLMVEKYGADCFRLYEMFLGPIEQSKPWNTSGIEGTYKFLKKMWGLFFDKNGNFNVSDEKPTPKAYKILHTAIKKIQDDIERFSLNTCPSALMVCVNDLKADGCNNREILQNLVVLSAPFTPFIAEELWQLLGNNNSVTTAAFPTLNEAYLVEDTFVYPIAINGKTRTTIAFAADTDKETLEKTALADEKIQKHLEGKSVKKVIVVPKKMINIVVV